MVFGTRSPELETLFAASGGSGRFAVHLAKGLLGAVEQPVAAPGLSPSAGQARRAEFVAGRTLARHCLIALSRPPEPVGRGMFREPVWPAGLSGSITHTEQLTAAVVFVPSENQLAGVGIDAEPCEAVDTSLYPTVFTPDERDFLASITRSQRAQFATCMFSAKESFYKAQFAIGRSFVDFLDVAVEFPFIEPSLAEEGRLTLRCHAPALERLRSALFYRHLGATIVTGTVVTMPVK